MTDLPSLGTLVISLIALGFAIWVNRRTERLLRMRGDLDRRLRALEVEDLKRLGAGFLSEEELDALLRQRPPVP